VTQAALVEALHEAPERRDLAWRLGLDEQVTEPLKRMTELRNFLDRLVLPTRAARGRG
jgi:GMP synthase (glutamine-hydrolysing)